MIRINRRDNGRLLHELEAPTLARARLARAVQSYASLPGADLSHAYLRGGGQTKEPPPAARPLPRHQRRIEFRRRRQWPRGRDRTCGCALPPGEGGTTRLSGDRGRLFCCEP